MLILHSILLSGWLDHIFYHSVAPNNDSHLLKAPAMGFPDSWLYNSKISVTFSSQNSPKIKDLGQKCKSIFEKNHRWYLWPQITKYEDGKRYGEVKWLSIKEAKQSWVSAEWMLGWVWLKFQDFLIYKIEMIIAHNSIGIWMKWEKKFGVGCRIYLQKIALEKFTRSIRADGNADPTHEDFQGCWHTAGSFGHIREIWRRVKEMSGRGKRSSRWDK